MAQRTASTGTVTTTGVGKPDYSDEVSSGFQRAGYRLKSNQTLKLFFLTPSSKWGATNPFAWARAVLLASGSAHLVDAATGLATPYTVPAGYSLTLVEKTCYASRQVVMWLYFDGEVVACPMMAQTGGGGMNDNNVVPYTTLWIDPTAAVAHTVDALVENQDSANTLEGGFSITAILEAVGTPPLPETKQVRCHFCREVTEVHWAATTVKCPKCRNTVVVIADQRGPQIRHAVRG